MRDWREQRHRRERRGRPGVRRVVVVVPSMFTLANLFFGIWSMVLSARGEYYRASWYIVIAGVLDMLDGRVARMSRAGSRFGAELDSLVDVVSFGVAPALLVHYLVFAAQGGFAWLFSTASSCAWRCGWPGTTWATWGTIRPAASRACRRRRRA
jgi:phosphatidylserine synthase